LLFKVADKI